jgi:hypothetical protein
MLYFFQPPPPPLYIITPTYRRPEEIAELTRLGYTLKHVPNIFWLVIEDAEKPTPLVTKLLEKMKIPFEHLVGNCRFMSNLRALHKPLTAHFSNIYFYSTNACQI